MWIEEGKTTWEIARILDITERTVRFHVEEIFKKLNTTTRAQAIAKAHKGGLLPSPHGMVSTGESRTPFRSESSSHRCHHSLLRDAPHQRKLQQIGVRRELLRLHHPRFVVLNRFAA
jgi:hypothetical protein